MLRFVVVNVGNYKAQKSLNAKNPLNPVGFVVKAEGFEPSTACLEGTI